MEWIKFNEEIRRDILLFAKKSSLELFEKLSPYEQSYFYHYWNKVLNEHISYALLDQGRIAAFISKPEWTTKHWMRWPENLVLVEDPSILIGNLPEEFKEDLLFRTFNSDKWVNQYAYVCDLKDFHYEKLGNLNRDLDFYELGNDRLDKIESLFHRDNRHADGESGFYEDYYLPDLISNVKANHKDHFGIGFYATLKGEKDPIAVAFYDGFELPLLGTPCMLINDIVVNKEFRRKRVATSLQAFAYNRFKQDGQRWVLGNIANDNVSSLKQAKALNRMPMTCVVELREETK